MKSNSDSIYIMYLRKDTSSKTIECLFQDFNNAFFGIKDLSGGILVGKTKLMSNPQINVTVSKADGWCPVWLYYHEDDDFDKTKGNVSDYPFGQALLLQGNSNYYEQEEGTCRCPILHIANLKNALIGVDQSNFRRYYNIMDSSIWNYLISDIEDEENGELCFDKAVNSIYENYQKGLYDLLISQEYADLNARICKEAYLVDLGGGHSDGVSPFIFHSEHYVKKQLIKKEFEEVRPTLQQIVNRKWRILLVDDKAFMEMDKIGERDVTSEFQAENMPWNCKLNIIIRLLRNLLKTGIEYKKYSDKTKSIHKDTKILVEYAVSLEEAYEALKTKKYDIILLDYLLKPIEDAKNKYGYQLLEYIYKQILLEERARDFLGDKQSTENAFNYLLTEPRYEEILRLVYYLNSEISYYDTKDGNSLVNLYKRMCDIEEDGKEKDLNVIRNDLDSIIEDKKVQIASETIKVLQSLTSNDNSGFAGKENVKIGPMGRFFIVFTSAYSSAVYERLLAQGLNPNEDYWCISTGACPTNTPQLFLYNLIKMMEMRLDNTGILKLAIPKIYELVEKIYSKEAGGPRECANKHYQDVLSLQYHYRKMLADVEIPEGNSIFDTKESVLISEFIKNNVNLGGMLEHLTQLVHLTAFGTVRQWPEMWEEYIYFKSLFKAQLGIGQGSIGIDEFDKMTSHIEDYIKLLKSQ